MSLLGSILGGIAGAISGSSITWYCDECGTVMNNQPGFNTSSGWWICAECGCGNDVTPKNVFDSEEDYQAARALKDDDDYSSEALSVWDAADIWQSNGYDEDYTFGYSEEELKKALK